MSPVQKKKAALQKRTQDLLKSQNIIAVGKDALALKIGEMDSAATLKPSLLKRVSLWVEQLTNLKRKEQDIISQLDAIDRKHALMRKAKRVRIARPAKTDSSPSNDEPQPQSRFWFWFFALVVLLSGRKNTFSAPQNG